MASAAFDRKFFSITGLRSLFTRFQLQYERPLLGGQLKAQIYSVYPGNDARKEQAYQRVKRAFQAGVTINEAPAGEVILVRNIPVYGQAGNPPGVTPRRFVFQVNVKAQVNRPGQPSETIIRSILVQSDETLTRDEITSRVKADLLNRFRSDPRYKTLDDPSQLSIQSATVQWAIRRS